MTEQKTNRWHFSSSIIGNPVSPQWNLYDNVSNVIAVVQPARDQYDEAKAFIYMAVAAPAMLEVLQEIEWITAEDSAPFCYSCESRPPIHGDNCKLAAAIKAATD